ncbi:GlxA family transcriptional regulator [Williamsia maris]|uniref:Transcriptional regulator GlxA family, contains an amidase domain and an AraC-type DNA-binding HTH domain n=1 Tax=Williamsia maris TaxID=72806 RepID=A0ABT1H9Y6_9NOCA|nr:GlxA family transcriptional regulator [Williamsia maris]MCP2175075.1 Transcriptional regulator GlxA family, contains an amidase domain and an AraC-type DNA-binding HTH domain [Williamsia maris]
MTLLDLPTGPVPRRRIGILVFDGVKMLDFAGPAEVFIEANQTVDNYDVVLVSPDGNDVATSIGARMSVSAAAADAGWCDTVIIPGSEMSPSRFVTPEVLAATTSLAQGTRRLASVCSGAFVLAALGVLDGRRATTHWKFTDNLARLYPAVDVEPDSIFVRDGNVYSSAGVAAGMDLALALVEEDHGPHAARRVAQSLLVYMQRAGGQSQFSASLTGPVPRSDLVRELTDLICADPTEAHTVRSLAAHAGVSARHLTRLFRAELESSPAEYVAQVRFALARDKLDAGLSVTETATAAGYGSGEALRRAFVARLGISPSKYQRRFRSTVSSDVVDESAPEGEALVTRIDDRSQSRSIAADLGAEQLADPA